MAGKRFVLHSLRPLRRIALILGLVTLGYLELVSHAEADPEDHAIMFGFGLFMGAMALAILLADRNFRAGRIVFEIDEVGVVVTQSTVWPRPRRLPYSAIVSISVRRRDDKVSLRLQPRAGRAIRLRVDDATCDYMLSMIPSSIPIRNVEVPAARLHTR